ncbi:hypothetical protein Ssed_2199 [Shewanella sediminis HAW-EB3]|uniref:Uncharacterized protein n=1 Tax=Shewanella sediminis (strain HAW-EB3) TaxID=425104 RepID=A8FVD5_SHESH|nr:hypothetical protein [Shewanella sediminis]ABV36808.1 hypothetical protein Ssed_2199 [Shewanella sediminis HAW-EB3]
MAANSEKINRLIWRLLETALGDDLPEIQQEVTDGRSILTSWGNEFFAVLRDEQAAKGKELVIVAAAGKNSQKHTFEIMRQAKLQGYYSVRLHTLKPEPMLRMSKAAGLGLVRAETVLRRVF